jgi:hypothetical protein
MDPITTAITAALANVAKDGVKDAYEALKTVISRKWGKSSPILKAISATEDDPNSKAQAAVLEEKVVAFRAAADPEVAQALRKLNERLQTHGITGVQITGNRFGDNALGANNNGTIGNITLSIR